MHAAFYLLTPASTLTSSAENSSQSKLTICSAALFELLLSVYILHFVAPAASSLQNTPQAAFICQCKREAFYCTHLRSIRCVCLCAPKLREATWKSYLLRAGAYTNVQ